MKTPFAAVLCLIASSLAFSQTKEIQHDEQVWAAYFNQTRFSEKWGLWADFHLRTKTDFFTDLSTAFGRLGLTYYLHDDAKLTLGYGYFNHFPDASHPDVSQPEHRPWQQLQWHAKFPKLRLMQYIRLEERYRRKLEGGELADGYNFNYRLRLNCMLLFPLSQKRFQPKTLSFVLNDELHINFGETVVYNSFDHNRFFIGFNYHLSANSNLQFGYMNFYQQQAAGNKYRSIHVPRVFYLHALDLRKGTAGK